MKRKVFVGVGLICLMAVAGCRTAPALPAVSVPFAHSGNGFAVAGAIGYDNPDLTATVAVDVTVPTSFSNDWLTVNGSIADGKLHTDVSVRVPLAKE